MHKARAKGMGQGWDYVMEQGKGYGTMGQGHGTRLGLRDYGVRTRDKAWAKGIWA